MFECCIVSFAIVEVKLWYGEDEDIQSLFFFYYFCLLQSYKMCVQFYERFRNEGGIQAIFVANNSGA